ncbi:G-protein coupled receptor 87 [Heterocephalus glaber]|uniref:G-protein coupled receptor 87 n=1 Tax=Heterocephalus glaber TaxID=10181 RepID=G5C100_HETGA|nr:G-protein coupled receptor 87 [Heterocephalus glaber]
MRNKMRLAKAIVYKSYKQKKRNRGGWGKGECLENKEQERFKEEIVMNRISLKRSKMMSPQLQGHEEMDTLEFIVTQKNEITTQMTCLPTLKERTLFQIHINKEKKRKEEREKSYAMEKPLGGQDNELPSQASPTPNNTTDGPGKNITLHNEFDTIVLPVLYVILFVASILLNGLAVWIFFHIRNKTSFIFYLKNIVVADLIMTLTFPFRIVHDAGFGPWFFKSILCRYTSVLFYANMYTSIVFLGLISIDRYLKVVKPFGDSRMYSITFTKVLSVCVWVIMAVLSLPNIILTNSQPTKENIYDCMKLKSPLGVKWHKAVNYVNSCLFVVVLVILIGCYIAISSPWTPKCLTGSTSFGLPAELALDFTVSEIKRKSQQLQSKKV